MKAHEEEEKYKQMHQIELEKIKLERVKEEKELMQLKIQLKDTNNNSYITNNTTNNTNNGTIINNTFYKFGDGISYNKLLSKKEIKKIIQKMFKSLEESITQIHYNEKYPEHNNFFITNLHYGFFG